MIGIIINGEIKKFSKIPENWKNHCGFNKLETAVHQEAGFFEILNPIYDTDLKEIGQLAFDEIHNVFSYPTTDIVLNLEEIRLQKHAEFAEIVEGEMTDALKIGVLEKLALGEPIPQETIDKIISLRQREQEVKTLIDNIQDPVQLKKFKFDRIEIEADKDELKSARKL